MTLDPLVARLSNTAGVGGDHIEVWSEVRDRNMVAPHDPIPLRALADSCRLPRRRVADCLAHLRRLGWVHVEPRKLENGAPAPSRIRAVSPRRPDRSRSIDRLMREVPRG